MNKRLTALLLALALTLSVGMVSALADEEIQPAEENAAAAAEMETTETAAGEGLLITASGNAAVEETPVIEVEEATPDMILFKDVAELVRKNSPAYGALAAQIAYVEETQDYVEELQGKLAQVMARIAELSRDPGADPAMLARLQAQQVQLQTAISSFASVAQQDTTQMEAGCDQIIMGCESLYIGLVNLEIQETALVRQIASLERTLEELKVRQEWGQVSKLQVMELESGLNAAVSGLATLRTNETNLKMQLEQMIGEKITGTVVVGALPRVSAEQLQAIDVEKDLKTVLRRNPDVQAANDADNALWNMSKDSMSEGMWDALDDANDYTLENAKQQAEIKFRLIHATLLNKRQAVEDANTALELEQLTYNAAALKYQQGTISHNALLAAEDDLQTAKEAVETAENDLFAAHNQYQWAVKHGVLS